MANGHGGARVGTGPKPRVVRIDGGRSGDVSAKAPDDLPQDQRRFWETYAESAISMGTLTPQTVASFRLLCELDAEKAAVKATIDRDGRTFIKCTVDGAGNEHQELKAHPLKADYAKLAKDVDKLMGRFMLAPFGKPAPGARQKKSADAPNPWARIVGGGA